MAKKKTGQITEAKLKLLKKKNKNVHIIEVDMNDRIAVGYFKAPTLQEFSIVMGVVSINATTKETKIKDFERFTNVLVQNCWLDGDEEIRADEMAAFAAAQKLFTLIQPKVARIKNA